MDPTRRSYPQHRLLGPRPPPLRVSKNSVKIKKPPPHRDSNSAEPDAYGRPCPYADFTSEDRSRPVIIYRASPKVIHPSPRGPFSYSIADLVDTGFVPQLRPRQNIIGNVPRGILSPTPSSLPPISPNLFSLLPSDPSLTILNDLSAVGYLGESGVTGDYSEMLVDNLADITSSPETLRAKKSGVVHNIWWRHPSTVMDKPTIYGRGMDLENVVKMLLNDNSSNIQGHVSIVPIIGQDGIGKTTLAKLVYNDNRIRHRFDVRGWVSMSKGIDILTVTKELLTSFSKRYLKCIDPSAFRDKFIEEILGRRILIVLDDVSFVKDNFWYFLRSQLVSARSCKILATTHSLQFFIGIPMMFPYKLSCLSTQDSFSIFKEFHPIIERLPNFLKFGRSIVEKCVGVPLSIKVLGGVLSFQKDENVWPKVLDSELWVDMPLGEFDTALMVAFDCMPSALKQCFSIFSLFTKQHVFCKDDMVLLWMSLIHLLPQVDVLPEKNFNSFFDDLVCASIIQKADVDRGIEAGFVIHNLLYDLAQTICGEEFLKLDDEISRISGNVRYLSIIRDNLGNIIDLQLLQQVNDLRLLRIANKRSKFGEVKTKFKLPTAESFKHLRVLILNNIHMDEFLVLIGNLRQLSYLSLRNTATKDLPESVFHLYNLIYLDLMDCPIRELPNSIGNLKQLRSLNLRNTCINILPESVGLLQKLVSLDLMDCDIRELPKGIVHLINLEQLKFNWWRSVCMPSGIRLLAKLVKLERFEIKKGDWHCKIGDLVGLVNLKGYLCISGLRNVTSIGEVEFANLKDKPHLRALRLELSSELCEINQHCNTIEGPSHMRNVDFTVFDAEVLERLRPHTNLEYLHISGYGGCRLPNWLCDVSFGKLSKIELIGREEGCEYLPALGMLPSLRILSISSFWSVQSVRHEFCSLQSGVKGFQSLNKLVFDDMVNWMEWSGVQNGEFCSLEVLKVLDIPKLRSIPEKLSSSSISKLLIKDCKMLSKLPNLPFLSVLVLKGQLNPNMFTCLDLPLLRTLKVCNSNNIRSLPLSHEKLIQLKVLIIHACRNLRNLIGLSYLKALKIIKISDCESIQFPLNEKLPVSLRRIDISGCSKLQKWKQICKNKYFEQLYGHDEADDEIEAFAELSEVDVDFEEVDAIEELDGVCDWNLDMDGSILDGDLSEAQSINPHKKVQDGNADFYGNFGAINVETEALAELRQVDCYVKVHDTLAGLNEVSKQPFELDSEPSKVYYPWKKKMEGLPISNSSIFLSILILPKALDQSSSQYHSFEDTLTRANAWIECSKMSGVPIFFLNVQIEQLFTQISGKAKSTTLNSGSFSDLSEFSDTSLNRFEGNNGVGIGSVKAVRLWYTACREIPVEIQLKEGDTKLGFAINRTNEGFICISAVIDDDQDRELPSTRSGLSDLYKESQAARKLLVISRVAYQNVLPWSVSSSGAIHCFDTVSLANKLSAHCQAGEPILLHVLVGDHIRAIDSS